MSDDDIERERLRVITTIDLLGEFVTLEDGFVHYWPHRGGGLSSHVLRWIADELDRRNADWLATVNAQ